MAGASGLETKLNNKKPGGWAGFADADVVIVRKDKAQFVVERRGQAHRVRRATQWLYFVGVVAAAIASITCGNAQNHGANQFDWQRNAFSNLDAHVWVALRDAVGGKGAAIAACSACRAAMDESNSRAAADGAGRSRLVGRRSGGRCDDDWHRA
eukprot:2599772-Pleurochrysis_carterae.AAC.2